MGESDKGNGNQNEWQHICMSMYEYEYLWNRTALSRVAANYRTTPHCQHHVKLMNVLTSPPAQASQMASK